jgi:hypothetical protein
MSTNTKTQKRARPKSSQSKQMSASQAATRKARAGKPLTVRDPKDRSPKQENL